MAIERCGTLLAKVKSRYFSAPQEFDDPESSGAAHA
jgi:hypothetical protein